MQRAVAGSGHDKALHTLRDQRLHHRATGTRVIHHNFDARPVSGLNPIHYYFDSYLRRYCLG